MNLPQLAQDKANHFVYGAIITAVVTVPFSVPTALAVGCFAAVLKEVVDGVINWKTTGNFFMGPHTVDPFDAIATQLGSFAVAFPYLIKLF